MKLYLYGIIDSSDQIKESICGLEGSNVYNIPFCDIGAVVSEMSQPIQAVIEGNVLEHETVVEKLMVDFTVLPARFQTIIDGRDDLLSMMRSYYKDFKDNLARLHNKLEFGIKVLWPADKIKENIIQTLKEGRPWPAEPDCSANKRFIRGKFETYQIDEKFEKKANKFIDAMDIFFSKFAAEKKLKRLKTENLLLDAVYLVEKDKENDFRDAFEHIKSAHEGFKFLFSGPWPPYNFVILPKKNDLLKESEKKDLFDKVIQCMEPVGAREIWQ
jgi:hypothetical protein